MTESEEDLPSSSISITLYRLLAAILPAILVISLAWYRVQSENLAILATKTHIPSATFTSTSTATATTTPTLQPVFPCSAARPDLPSPLEPISDDHLLEYFAGIYTRDDGSSSLHQLVIVCHKEFLESILPKTGQWDYVSGRVVIARGTINLNGVSIHGASWLPHIPVRLGAQRYLVLSEELTRFCADVETLKQTGAADTTALSYYYLMTMDLGNEISGDPILPSGEKACP